MTPRETALQVLIACRREQGWSNGVLKQQLAKAQLSRRDAALATRLSYGVVQNRLLLDYYLGQLLTGKSSKLHPVIRDILHLGLYQIKLLDRIPDSAAVHESVELAKKCCKKQPYAPGLVNAVLRSAASTQLSQPKDLATRYSHPQGLVDLLKSYVGQDKLESMLIANNGIPETVVQVNTRRTTATQLQACLEAEGVQVRPHPWMDSALVLSGTGSMEQLPSFREGLFYVQDAAARLAVDCAAIPQGADWRVLDCCAAPGGKSFAAAMALGEKGSILSCDIHPHKLPLIEAGARRLGIENLSTACQDASVPVEDLRARFDLVLCDVPCSGYGIIRKKPDIRYKDPDSMAQLHQLQLQILLNQADRVKPGGVLLYSTCTLVREENEGVVEAFLKERTDFVLEPLPLPGVFPVNASGMLALVPGEYDTDGFFICRLRRKV